MNVPKFASFRPKPDQSSTSRVIEKSKTKDEERSRTKSSENDRRRPDKSYRSRSKDRGDQLPESSPQKQIHNPDSTLFVVDRQGDVKNLVYGGLHKYDVPLYRRVGTGSVLGVGPHLKIQRDLSDDKGLALAEGHLLRNTKREKYVFAKMEKPRLLKVRRQDSNEPEAPLWVDYLSFDPSRDMKRSRLDHDGSGGSGSENERGDYRSIEGKAKSNQPEDPALEYASDSEDFTRDSKFQSLDFRKKGIELNRAVEVAPYDLNAWLALISHQDSLLLNETDRQKLTNAEVRSTAEIKIHLYEKALQNIKSLNEKEVLLQNLMSEGSKIWEVKYQLEKWEQIARENIESTSLWRCYLDFKQTTFTAFRFEEVRAVYAERFKLLSGHIEGNDTSSTASFAQQLVYVLVRYTIFLRSSGFRELGVAVWQAILELNFRPPSSCISWKRAFQEFWESEGIRIGEDGSLGWSFYYENVDKSSPPLVQIDQPSDPIRRDSVFGSWVLEESKMQQTSSYPARTMDETVEDDPFRVILFSDIEDFLFKFPTTMNDAQEWLINGFLLFCRLPPYAVPDNRLLSDALITDNIITADVKWLCKLFEVDQKNYVSEQPISARSESSASNFIPSAETYFNPNWFHVLPYWDEIYGARERAGPVSYTWVRNTIKQLLEAQYSDSLAEYYLAFEWCNNPSKIKKTAKSLLMTHTSNLQQLYNAYGLIEWAKGNTVVASSVFKSAINMTSQSSEDEKVASIRLWKSLIWCCIDNNDHSLALSYLLSIPDGKLEEPLEQSPAATIRAKHYLASSRDHLVSTASIAYATIYAELLALLAYLTSTSSSEPQAKDQGDVTSFLSFIASFTETLTSRKLANSPQHELFLQSAARLLCNHARTGPFRPILLRNTLQRYLAFFPSNTILLSLYAWNESRFRIENRVRNLLNAAPIPTLAQHLFRIHYELQNGTIHSARAAFEHAVMPPTSVAKSHAGTWKLYILFMSKHFKNKTKDVWYSALRACPWEKELYMVGFEVLGDTLDFAELKGTWRVMGEKGLRVHVDLEEVFEDME